jgi:hypothetical protein
MLFFIGFSSHAQKQIFESPKLDSIIKLHKTVAILPLTVKITYKKQPKNFSAEGNRDQEDKMSQSIQSSMFTFLLKKLTIISLLFKTLKKRISC